MAGPVVVGRVASQIISYISKHGVRKAAQKFGKKAVDLARKADAAIERQLDKVQGVTTTTPGRTAKGRGVVVGKKRTKAYGRTKAVKGAAYGAAATAAVTAANSGRTRGELKRIKELEAAKLAKEKAKLKKLEEENKRLKQEVRNKRKRDKGFPFTSK